jgi:hypothetical protein
VNQGIGATLYITLFPEVFMRSMERVGHKVYRTTNSGTLPDGTVFFVRRPVDINEIGMAGLNLRRVILTKNVALGLDQIELLHTRNRGILPPEEFISVRRDA